MKSSEIIPPESQCREIMVYIHEITHLGYSFPDRYRACAMPSRYVNLYHVDPETHRICEIFVGASLNNNTLF